MGFKPRKKSFVLFGRRYYEGVEYADVHREDLDMLVITANCTGLYVDFIGCTHWADALLGPPYLKWRAVRDEADLGPSPYEQQL